MVCQKYSGEVLPPGGILFENALLGITHAQLLGDEKEHYLGHLFVETQAACGRAWRSDTRRKPARSASRSAGLPGP